jgi:predicted amidophosphoribosyltransferase
MATPGRCPVCQARFRGAAECPRCGADLRPLMLLAIDSWRAREAARQALLAGDAAAAHRQSCRAQEVCSTAAGERLRLFTAWLLDLG